MPGTALYLGSTGRHSRATWGGKGLARSSSQLQGSNSAHQDLLSSNLSCSLREDGEDKKKTNQPPETLYGMGRKHRAIKMGGKKKNTFKSYIKQQDPRESRRRRLIRKVTG